MSETLEALYAKHRVGTLRYADDRVTFAYADEWRDDPNAFPLSLSMPLSAPDHGDAVVRPFISGLLPDDTEVLRHWGQRFHVSPPNPFRLLGHIGEECAGAIQFVPPERVPDWLGDSPPEGIDWLDGSDFIERVEGLMTDSSRARRLGDEGHFSLAGAQAKTALYRDPQSDRWGIPKGTIPTTHIIKPSRGKFEHFEINEHFCLRLAKQLGVPSANSWTQTIGRTPTIIVERYDRTWIDGHLVRIHQEDACQAFARKPDDKYQNEGGPSASEIFGLIRDQSSKPPEDVERFLKALIFNYLIGGTDAHAKNYSLLLAGGGQARLAPLYDLISIFPYNHEPRQVKLAMKIGGEYLLWKIGPRQWEKASEEWDLDSDLVFARITEMAEAIPEATQAVGAKMADLGEANAEFLQKLITQIAECAQHCLQDFNSPHEKIK